MNFDIFNIIKENRKEELSSLLQEFGKLRLLSECAQFLDKRAFTTIDLQGNIKRKINNFILPTFAFFNDETLLIDEIFKACDLKEKQNLDKIERFSSLDIEKVKFNFIKTLFNGNLEFSKKYGKELFLRDRESFFKTISNFALIGNSSDKPLMVLALKKLMTSYDDNIFYLFIAYMTKYRDNTDIYENIVVENKDLSIEDLKITLKNNSSLLNSLEGLKLLTTLTLLEEIEVDNRERALEKINFEITNIKNYTPLNFVEKELLKIFL